jgi:hypothetical protein
VLSARRGPVWQPGAPVVLEDEAGRVLAVAAALGSEPEDPDKPDKSPLRYLCVLPAASS